MAKKQFTINDLAGMVKRGFDEMGGNFDQMKSNLRIMSENNKREHEEIMMRLDSRVSL